MTLLDPIAVSNVLLVVIVSLLLHQVPVHAYHVLQEHILHYQLHSHANYVTVVATLQYQVQQVVQYVYAKCHFQTTRKNTNTNPCFFFVLL